MKKETIIIIVLSLFLIISLMGLFIMKTIYDKAPIEAYLLNGTNKDMYSKNILLAISSDFKKQFITGGSLYITNEKIINEAKSVKLEICYTYDNQCVFNTSLNSDSKGVLKSNNPLTVGSRSTTSFKDGFIKKQDGSLFKTRNEFTAKLTSMYFKVTVIYGDNSNEIFHLKINPNHKMNKRIPLYELPFENK